MSPPLAAESRGRDECGELPLGRPLLGAARPGEALRRVRRAVDEAGREQHLPADRPVRRAHRRHRGHEGRLRRRHGRRAPVERMHNQYSACEPEGWE